MKRFIVGLLLLTCLATLPISAEAIVLSPGTTIVFQDGRWQSISDPMFLLTREDMETAALAMETVLIREKEVADLKKAYKELEGKTFLIAGGAALGTALVTTIVVLLVGR